MVKILLDSYVQTNINFGQKMSNVLCVCVTVKFLQQTRDGESNSVEILRDLDNIETATTQMEQHLGRSLLMSKM